MNKKARTKNNFRFTSSSVVLDFSGAELPGGGINDLLSREGASDRRKQSAADAAGDGSETVDCLTQEYTEKIVCRIGR